MTNQLMVGRNCSVSAPATIRSSCPLYSSTYRRRRQDEIKCPLDTLANHHNSTLCVLTL